MTEDKLLTVPEVAARLRASPDTVRRWLRTGKLRGLSYGGDRLGYRVSESELQRFLAASATIPSGGTPPRGRRVSTEVYPTSPDTHLPQMPGEAPTSGVTGGRSRGASRRSHSCRCTIATSMRQLETTRSGGIQTIRTGLDANLVA